MALKKKDRKEKLCELHSQLQSFENNNDKKHIEEAIKIVIDMLSHDGLYIIGKNK